MPGKRILHIGTETVMVPSDLYAMMEAHGAIVDRRVVSYRGLDPVETLYFFADEDHKNWRLYAVAGGTGEGTLTYAKERPRLMIPRGGALDQPGGQFDNGSEFGPGTYWQGASIDYDAPEYRWDPSWPPEGDPHRKGDAQ